MTLTAAILFCGASLAQEPVGAPPAGARVYIISPADGEAVHSPVHVQFGLQGMGVAPAGVNQKGTGHHHLLVDVADVPPANQPMPSDEHHMHFGGGQTETTIKLSPGKHTLRLVMGDYLHRPTNPPVASALITIQVLPPAD